MQDRPPPAWQRVDPRARQRGRWLVLARAEAEAADAAGEPHVAEAFRIVAATLELDRLPEPPCNGREVLKGRHEAYVRAVALAEAGLSARSVARAVDVPYLTVYTWLRRAGVAPTRDQWRERVRAG